MVDDKMDKHDDRKHAVNVGRAVGRIRELGRQVPAVRPVSWNCISKLWKRKSRVRTLWQAAAHIFTGLRRCHLDYYLELLMLFSFSAERARTGYPHVQTLERFFYFPMLPWYFLLGFQRRKWRIQTFHSDERKSVKVHKFWILLRIFDMCRNLIMSFDENVFKIIGTIFRVR